MFIPTMIVRLAVSLNSTSFFFMHFEALLVGYSRLELVN